MHWHRPRTISASQEIKGEGAGDLFVCYEGRAVRGEQSAVESLPAKPGSRRAAMALSPSLVRLVVLPDGEVHVTFSDHSAVIINHTATVLAIVNPDGTTVRHLTQCVTSAHRQRATQALHARNTLCVDAPRVQWGLLPPDRASASLSARPPQACRRGRFA